MTFVADDTNDADVDRADVRSPPPGLDYGHTHTIVFRYCTRYDDKVPLLNAQSR
ncbi:MAG: hypothetical protein F6K09_02935 [Merismopedia sp. SIO2A8]|nr:hypothetical protein [Merismopedia sp. SIO2A8]